MAEEERKRGIGLFRKTLYFGSADLGREIQEEIEKRVLEAGPGWTFSRLMLQSYREDMIRRGYTTIVPDQEPTRSR